MIGQQHAWRGCILMSHLEHLMSLLRVGKERERRGQEKRGGGGHRKRGAGGKGGGRGGVSGCESVCVYERERD